MPKIQGFDVNFNGVLSAGDYLSTPGMYGFDSSSGAITCNLGSSNTSHFPVKDGTVILVQDEGGTASTAALTLDAVPLTTVNGGSSVQLNTDGGGLIIYRYGSEFYARNV